MANDLTTTTGLPTRYSPPVLSASLRLLLSNPDFWTNDAPLPALKEDERAEAIAALAAYESAPSGSRPEHVAKLVGTLSWMPRRRADGTEKLMLQVYERQLADIDEDVLAAAFDEATKRLTFFPSIAELREIAASLPAPKRVARSWKLRRLLAVPAEAAPRDLVPAADLEALNDAVLASLSVRQLQDEKREPVAVPPPLPTVDDYERLGLSHEDATRAFQADRAARAAAVGPKAEAA